MILVTLKIVHLIAAAIWLGGLAFNFFVLNLSVAELNSKLRVPVFAAVLKNFIPFMWLNIALVLATGGFIIFNRLDTFIDDFKLSFGYEMWWVAKLTLATIMVILSTIVSIRFKKSFDEGSDKLEEFYPKQLKLLAGANIVFAIAILAVVGILQEEYIRMITGG